MNVRRVVMGIGAVAGLGALMLGCGSDAPMSSAAEVCGGSLSPTARKSLELITGQREFGREYTDEKGPQNAARNFANEYPGESDGYLEHGESACLVPSVASGQRFLEVNFDIGSEKEVAAKARTANFKKYNLGVETISLPQRSYLYFSCVSPELKTKKKGEPVVIGAEMLNHYVGEKGEGVKAAPGALQDANVAVLRSVASAFAEALRCEDAAGLG